jgi:hypothetical protein
MIKSISLEEAYRRKMEYISLLRTRPIAIKTAAANKQHYRVGTGVFGCLFRTSNEVVVLLVPQRRRNFSPSRNCYAGDIRD